MDTQSTDRHPPFFGREKMNWSRGSERMVSYFKGWGSGSVKGEEKAEFWQLEFQEEKNQPFLSVKCADAVEMEES